MNSKCCDDDNNLEFIRTYSFENEIWSCNKCKNQFYIDIIRDVDNKEIIKKGYYNGLG